METFKLDPSANGLKNCGNCIHRYEERLPNQVMLSLVCHRFPPQLLAVPVVAAPASPIQLGRQAPPQPSGYQVVAMFPVVQPQQFCHCHTLRVGDGEDPVPVIDPDQEPANPIPHRDQVKDS